MKILKRITHIAALLTALVLLTVTASPAFAAGKTEQIRTGDVVCFGTPDAACGFDGKWLVLDSEHTNTGAPGMFLVSLNLIGSEKGRPLLFRDIGDVSVSFSDRGEAFAEEHPGSTDYQGSDIQTWCEDFAQNHLTQAEYQALLPTWKSDAATVIPGLGIPLPGVMTGTVDFDPVENILNGDRLFLLSAEEITNEQYGFSDGSSRIAAFKGTAEGYWLRSPHIPTFPLDVGFVFGFGAVMDFPVNANFMMELGTYARPACNLDIGSITNAEVLTVSDETTVWRLSFQDEANERQYDTSLPEKMEAMDLGGMLRNVLIGAVCVLILLVVLVIVLVRHLSRKRRAKRALK